MPDICRTCFSICEKEASITITNNMKSDLQYCVPEVDLSITPNPIVCGSCHLSLKAMIEFKNKCIETQNKIIICFGYKQNLDDDDSDSEKPKIKKQSTNKKAKIANGSGENSVLKLPQKKTFIPKIALNKQSVFKRKVGRPRSAVKSVTLLPLNSPKKEMAEASNSTVEEKKGISFDDDEDLLDMLNSSDNVQRASEMQGDLTPNGNSNLDDEKMFSDEENSSEEQLLDEERELRTVIKVSSTALFGNIAQSNTEDSTQSPLPASKPGLRLFQCKYCSFCAKYKFVLNKHMKERHTKDDKSIFRCPKCPFQTKDVGGYKCHMNRKHNIIKKNMYKCNQCSFLTKYSGSLKSHKLTQHREAKPIYKCDECDYGASNNKSLKIHHYNKHVRIYRNSGELTDELNNKVDDSFQEQDSLKKGSDISTFVTSTEYEA